MLDYSIGQGYSALDAQAWRDRLDGYAVASGLGVSVDTGLTLEVAAGTATVGETSGSVDTATLGSATTITLDSADSTNPRKDVIYIDTNGDIQKETGNAEAADPSGNVRFNTYQPEPPFPSTDGVILEEVWVAAGTSSLSSADVSDRRVPADTVGDRAVYQMVSTDDIKCISGYSGVSDTRSLGTWFQNTTGSDILVNVTVNPSSSDGSVMRAILDVNDSQSNRPFDRYYDANPSTDTYVTLDAWVPDGHYYQVRDVSSSGTSLDIVGWLESD